MNWSCKQNSHQYFKFLFTVSNRGILLKTNSINILDGTRSLLTYEETVEAPVNENTCKDFQICWFHVEKLSLSTKRIGYCKNLKRIHIVFARAADTMVTG